MTSKKQNIIYILITVAVSVLILQGCGKEKSKVIYFASEDSLRIIGEILAHRSSVDSSFRSDPQSPFVRDTNISFTGINWFPPDLRFYFKSSLTRYQTPETVQTSGTKGDLRQYVKYGYFTFEFEGNKYKLNAYKFIKENTQTSSMYDMYLSVWFTDETTGKETYHIGRYLDVGGETEDPDHLYTLNFNNAYNPYCAYSSLYSCVIPLREDHIPIVLNAGEKKSRD